LNLVTGQRAAFTQPIASWPDPATPPGPAYNATQEAIWSALDHN
jgi:hypothetical protein